MASGLRILTRFSEVFPVLCREDATCAFSGGTAVQLLLLINRWRCDRLHRDIDVYVANDSISRLFPGTPAECRFFCGAFDGRRLTTHSGERTTDVQICTDRYFDSEISPKAEDFLRLTIDGRFMSTLCPEFTIASKLTFPNVHRPFDYFDVLQLLRSDLVSFPRRLEALLQMTEIGRKIRVGDLLVIKTEREMEELMLASSRTVIAELLGCHEIAFESLDPLQTFALIGLTKTRVMSCPPWFLRRIDVACQSACLSLRKRMAAKIGLMLLAIGIAVRSGGSDVLDEHGSRWSELPYEFHDLIAFHTNQWLAICRTLYSRLIGAAACEFPVGPHIEYDRVFAFIITCFTGATSRFDCGVDFT